MVDVNKLIRDAQSAQSQGKDSLALEYFNQALNQYPNEMSLQIACANLCVKLARFEEAAGHFRSIMRLNKSQEVSNALCYALQALGNSAHQAGKYLLAETSFQEALQHQPHNAAYWYNIGNAQRELGKSSAAITSFQQAIKLNPQDADAYNNLGNVQRELGQLDLAINNYRQALNLNPNLYHALSHLIHQKQHICDWGGEESLENQIQTVRNWVNTKPEAKISPFAFLAMPSTTAEEQKRCASQYIKQTYQHLVNIRNTLPFKHSIQDKDKINIGYLSADFRLHPLAFLITEMIEQHDRERFTIHAYAYGLNDKTITRQRLEKAFDHFVDINQLNDIEAATKINQDQIDILVDLTGLTQHSRTGIVALKPAVIHINWLGFPGTMGEFSQAINKTPLFDYLIADKIIVQGESVFSEKIVYLPCYQPNSKREFSVISQKNEHHLPLDSFVFCCFNQTFKITPTVFDIWMRLLKQVPNSVLWLLECNPWAKENLEKAAEAADIKKHRLIFAPRAKSAVHLERQRHADLFLDTIPYNAHTTASDALWANVPVITYCGSTFPARVAASLLSQIGMEELICNSLEEYEAMALKLAKNPDQLKRVKAKINQYKDTSDLFNAEEFAKQLEAQYVALWQTQLKDTSFVT